MRRIRTVINLIKSIMKVFYNKKETKETNKTKEDTITFKTVDPGEWVPNNLTEQYKYYNLINSGYTVIDIISYNKNDKEEIKIKLKNKNNGKRAYIKAKRTK